MDDDRSPSKSPLPCSTPTSPGHTLRESDIKLGTQAAVGAAVQLAMIEAMREANPEMTAIFTVKLRRLALEADSRLPGVEPQLNDLADLAASGRSRPR